jgi:hypothetical protein
VDRPRIPVVLARVEFWVRDPVSVNRMYRFRRPGERQGDRFLTEEAREFKERVGQQFALARATTSWPLDPWRVAHVTLGYDLYDWAGDTDSPCKPIRDALQGLAFPNDRIVADGGHPRVVKDGNGRRVRVWLELHELFTPITAAALARRDTEARARREILKVKRKR